MKQRIQKALSQQGLGSRRQIEAWIGEGKITLNGEPAKIGDTVQPGDRIMFNGRKILIREASQQLPKIIAYNKPEGEVCTRDDPQGRPNIFQKLPKLKQGRWIMVGRLDINTSGLILLTDNGELANRLMHPSYQMEREYLVRTRGPASDEMLHQLTHGVQLEDGEARFEEVVDMDTTATGSHHWYAVLILEGRKREVRRMWEAVGMQVSRLKRVRYGPVALGKSHRLGRTRELTEKQVIELCDMVGLEYDLPTASAKSNKAGERRPARRPVTKARTKHQARDRNDGQSRDRNQGRGRGRQAITESGTGRGRDQTRTSKKKSTGRKPDQSTERDTKKHNKKSAPKKRIQPRTQQRGRSRKP
jgi:23S rRNA pseudouridine2605 synthase